MEHDYSKTLNPEAFTSGVQIILPPLGADNTIDSKPGSWISLYELERTFNDPRLQRPLPNTSDGHSVYEIVEIHGDFAYIKILAKLDPTAHTYRYVRIQDMIDAGCFLDRRSDAEMTSQRGGVLLDRSEETSLRYDDDVRNVMISAHEKAVEQSGGDNTRN